MAATRFVSRQFLQITKCSEMKGASDWAGSAGRRHDMFKPCVVVLGAQNFVIDSDFACLVIPRDRSSVLLTLYICNTNFVYLQY